jgi:hypothetical protein
MRPLHSRPQAASRPRRVNTQRAPRTTTTSSAVVHPEGQWLIAAGLTGDDNAISPLTTRRPLHLARSPSASHPRPGRPGK